MYSVRGLLCGFFGLAAFLSGEEPRSEALKFPYQDVEIVRQGDSLPELRLPGAAKITTHERERLLAGAKPGPFPGLEWRDRRNVVTVHYHLEGSIPEETAAYVAGLLEHAYAFYAVRWGRRPEGRERVFVFGSKEQFQTVVRERKIYNEEIPPGFYHFNRNPEFSGIYLPWLNTGLDPTATLLHEVSHQFFQRALGHNSPSWLNEGLAMYFESSRFDGERIVDGDIVPLRLFMLQRMLREPDAPTLAEVLRSCRFQMQTRHYPTAWGFIYWLTWGQADEDQNRRRQKKLCEYLTRLIGHPELSTIEEFEATMGLKLKDVEEPWKAWVLSLDPQRPFGGQLNPYAARSKDK